MNHSGTTTVPYWPYWPYYPSPGDYCTCNRCPCCGKLIGPSTPYVTYTSTDTCGTTTKGSSDVA